MHQQALSDDQFNEMINNPKACLTRMETALNEKKAKKKTAFIKSETEQIMHPFGKGKKPPVVEDDARLRERVPPRKAATDWDSPEQKERILASRKRWREARLAEEERDRAALER